MTKHDDHVEAARMYHDTYGGNDYLLYVARPSPAEPTRYVWTSGVKLGYKASVAHLYGLLLDHRADEGPLGTLAHLLTEPPQ